MAAAGESEQVREVCQAVAAEFDTVTEHAVDKIRAEITSYHAIPYREQYDYIRTGLAMMLGAVASPSGLTRLDSDRSRDLGRRRAMQGISLSDVIETYHIALRELWHELLTHSPEPDADLVVAVGRLWDVVHLETTAVAEGHSEAMRSKQAVRAGVRHRFFAALTAREERSLAAARELARPLGFDPDGVFRALCIGSEWPEAAQERLQVVLDGLRGAAHCSRHDAALVILCQGTPTSTIVEAVRTLRPDATIGVGLERAGLDLATSTLDDAMQALDASRAGTVTRFADAWLTASLTPQRERLAPILERGWAVARENPHLVDAVRAYADAGLSVSAAARSVNLHANSVTYRLDRWQALTGWDPRTAPGLLASVAALDLAPDAPDLTGKPGAPDR
ncbi:PucR family transcriptional regulator [Tsukamurella tyrosinosolvens]|uniref:PucR family transcriptional regulator n=1 Tax=Tsukamurella tyrosinosolvens TaxID=57704 RepID=UPI000DF6ADF1|nr:helix-turn-helix domain-containing protein [Tsukamurella tyrosinosolvens]RDB46017.1 PucR family transcriptional regulator [Tsukamurella tyrosinosolvens]